MILRHQLRCEIVQQLQMPQARGKHGRDLLSSCCNSAGFILANAVEYSR